MTSIELIWKVEAILAVIPAIQAYKEYGLLSSIGIYVGLVFVLGLLTALLFLLWSYISEQKKSQ